MATGDIFDLTNILLLGVAVLIFFRLRSVLGRRTGEERPKPIFRGAVTVPNAAPAPLKPQTKPVDERLGSVSKENPALAPLREIAAADPAFDAAAFVAGAKSAYELIVTAYAEGNRQTLRDLLSNDVYESFNAVILERETRGETTEFSFVGVLSAVITDCHLAGKMADISVKFESELVTAVRDRSGVIVEGDTKAVRRVVDIWTFARDVSSPNPNWRLVATDSLET